MNLSRVSWLAWPREQKESQVYRIYCLWDFSREVLRKITAAMLLLFFLLRFSRKTQAGSSARPIRIFYLLQLDSTLLRPSQQTKVREDSGNFPRGDFMELFRFCVVSYLNLDQFSRRVRWLSVNCVIDTRHDIRLN